MPVGPQDAAPRAVSATEARERTGPQRRNAALPASPKRRTIQRSRSTPRYSSHVPCRLTCRRQDVEAGSEAGSDSSSASKRFQGVGVRRCAYRAPPTDSRLLATFAAAAAADRASASASYRWPSHRAAARKRPKRSMPARQHPSRTIAPLPHEPLRGQGLSCRTAGAHQNARPPSHPRRARPADAAGPSRRHHREVGRASFGAEREDLALGPAVGRREQMHFAEQCARSRLDFVP